MVVTGGSNVRWRIHRLELSLINTIFRPHTPIYFHYQNRCLCRGHNTRHVHLHHTRKHMFTANIWQHGIQKLRNRTSQAQPSCQDSVKHAGLKGVSVIERD